MTQQPRTHHLFGNVPWEEALCAGQAGCDGSGYTTAGDGRRGICTCQIGRGVRGSQRARASKIPAKHFRLPPLEVSCQRMEEIIATVEEWAASYKPGTNSGLLFTGKPRTGKSHIAGAIAVHMLGRLTPAFAIDEPCPVSWVIWPEFLARIRDTFNRSRGDHGETELDIMDEIGAAKLAIIDDLGAEPKSASDWAEGTLCRVLERAVSYLNPTLIVTTNLTLAELSKRYGERVTGRLLEATSGPAGRVVLFSGVDNFLASRLKNTSSETRET